MSVPVHGRSRKTTRGEPSVKGKGRAGRIYGCTQWQQATRGAVAELQMKEGQQV